MPAILFPELRRRYLEPGQSPPSTAEGNDADAKRVCVAVLAHVLLVPYFIKQPRQGKLYPTSRKTQWQIFLWEQLNCEILHIRVIPWAGSLVYLAHKRDVSLQ
jgi:hypothetical protein